MGLRNLDPILNHTDNFELRRENKRLQAEVGALTEELNVIKQMYGLRNSQPIKTEVFNQCEIYARPNVTLDVPKSARIYAQRYLGKFGYQFLYDGKLGQFPFFVQFDGTSFDSYCFVRDNFGLSSLKQLVTLLNQSSTGKANIQVSMVGKDNAAVIAINVIGVHRRPNTVSKVNPKTYWFSGALYQSLSHKHKELLDMAIRI